MAHLFATSALIDRVAPSLGRRPPLVQLVQKIEDTHLIDLVALPEHKLAQKLVAGPRRRSLLLGRQLGHALHPLMTDLPLGSWTSAVVLDVAGGPGTRKAAERLLAFGCLAALPTVVTGFAEWAGTKDGDRRVGYVHAGLNFVALGGFAASWYARRKGRQKLGVALALAAYSVGGAGAYLGGHLSIGRGIGSHDPSYSANPFAREMSSSHRR